MKAITAIGPNHMEMLDIEKPVITEPDQVLVQIHAAGICGSNVRVAHRSNPYAVYPRAIGHEAAGEVEAARTAMKNIEVGDGVVFEPATHCGECYACRNDHRNVCRDLKVLGCIVDGTFREYAMVERSRAYQHDKRKVSYVQAALCEPYTIGSRANWRGNIRSRDVVLIHGIGPIGLIVAGVAKNREAVVIVSEPDENGLAMAAGFGVDHVVNPMKEDLDTLIMETTKGEGIDVVFETAGIPALLEHAVKILSPVSRLVTMTFGQTPIAIDFKTVNAKKFTILGARYQVGEFPETLEQLLNRLDRVDRLITRVFPVEKCEETFAVLTDKDNGTGKVVLTFD